MNEINLYKVCYTQNFRGDLIMSDDKEFKECKNMPENWKWVRLGEVIEEVNERKGKTNISTVLTVSNTEGLVDQTEFFGRNLSSKDTSNYKIVNKWCFVYNPARINVGSIALNDSYEYAIVSPMYSVFKTKEFLLPKYLSYWVQLPNFRYMVINNTAGSVRESLNFSRLTTFKLPLPPLSEQQKIAEILETIDNAIEKTDKIIEKYKRIKQGLMQDLLTKGIDENWQIRNEKTHKFKDSLLGRIPEEWKVVKLKDVADIRLSNVDKKTDLKGKIIQLCNYLEVYQNDYIIKGMNFMHASATNNEIKKFKISKGDVIITKDSEEYNDIAKPAYVRDEIENLICGYHLALIKPLNNINGLFLSKVLSFRNVNIYFQQRANGITRFGLTKETITGAIIPLPLIPEQERIATILSQIDEVIEKEQAYKEKLERIKKGLMEDLLTGKVRVNHLIEEGNKDGN